MATGDETRYDLVADYEFAEEAAVLAFTTSTKDGSGDGAYVVPLDDVARRALLEGEGRYEQLPLSKNGEGHSWGGYQVAYMITKTDLFAAAEAGAPVSNMTSAYGGIRWQTGMSRMFQYERTQSRIGGSLWEATSEYLHNSPLFYADKIRTPVLRMHNDDDGAVPWYQGIELFVALRRLQKPAWLLNYNGEGHGLRRDANRKDWAVRMQQFFDHYLQDAPVPVWMAEGVPAVDKGRTLGTELLSPDGR